MNRELKFRAFNFDYNQMLFLTLSSFYDDGEYYSDSLSISTIMQYTGLKDKNGKEIYEGDIINYGTDTNSVKWIEDGWYVFDPRQYAYENLREMIFACKIVGNIYENPELLEKENINE